MAVPLVADGAELKPAKRIDFTHANLRLGIDVGSTTVKLAVIDSTTTWSTPTMSVITPTSARRRATSSNVRRR
jgi:activator of 2-hydroxyglutaryl-CoA dehydratase